MNISHITGMVNKACTHDFSLQFPGPFSVFCSKQTQKNKKKFRNGHKNEFVELSLLKYKCQLLMIS